jgi:hypothetical protein
LPFIGEALLDLAAVQTILGRGANNSLCPPQSKYNRGLPCRRSCSHDVAVNLDKLRQMKYRQRLKNSLSILTHPYTSPLLAYAVLAM